MNIKIDDLERLRASDQVRSQQPRLQGNTGDAFSGLLSRQLLQSAQGEDTSAEVNVLSALADPARLANAGLMTLLGMENASGAEGSSAASGLDQALSAVDKALIDSVTGNLSTALDGVENYRDSLAQGGLKNAWNALSSLESSLQGARQSLGALPKNDDSLSSMVNELEILAATEKFKMNRGDYL